MFSSDICIGKTFRFEAAHALSEYDGPCANIHGHSYVLTVIVSSAPGAKTTCSTPGMILDFGELSVIVKEKIIARYDHKLILQRDSPFAPQILRDPSALVLTEFNPTCEMMLLDMRDTLLKHLPQHIILEKVELWETATSFAIWSRPKNR